MKYPYLSFYPRKMHYYIQDVQHWPTKGSSTPKPKVDKAFFITDSAPQHIWLVGRLIKLSI